MLSCFVLTFIYDDQELEDVAGTVFNPSFPVRAELVSFIRNNLNISFYFSLRVRM